MDYSARNLCLTVEPKPQYMLLPCVPRPKPNAYFPLDPDAEYDRRHSWGEGDRCAHCQRSLNEVRVRVNPKTGKPVRSGSLAREIAITAADIPPVQFIETTT